MQIWVLQIYLVMWMIYSFCIRGAIFHPPRGALARSPLQLLLKGDQKGAFKAEMHHYSPNQLCWDILNSRIGWPRRPAKGDERKSLCVRASQPRLQIRKSHYLFSRFLGKGKCRIDQQRCCISWGNHLSWRKKMNSHPFQSFQRSALPLRLSTW